MSVAMRRQRMSISEMVPLSLMEEIHLEALKASRYETDPPSHLRAVQLIRRAKLIVLRRHAWQRRRECR